MALSDKLSRLRRENSHTQEQLAGILGVSRQAISKWESGAALPETEKLIKLSELYNCSLDYLLKDDDDCDRASTVKAENNGLFFRVRRGIPEKKSSVTVCGLPLYHIGKNARGIIAIGFKARGVISVGLLSVGAVSFGLISFGLLAFGILVLGLLSLGCFSFGIISLGSISFGIVSLGALSVGEFSVGALAIGKYIAVGDEARAAIAIGKTNAAGAVFEKLGKLSAVDIESVKALLDESVPRCLVWAKELFKLFL